MVTENLKRGKKKLFRDVYPNTLPLFLYFSIALILSLFLILYFFFSLSLILSHTLCLSFPLTFFLLSFMHLNECVFYTHLLYRPQDGKREKCLGACVCVGARVCVCGRDKGREREIKREREREREREGVCLFALLSISFSVSHLTCDFQGCKKERKKEPRRNERRKKWHHQSLDKVSHFLLNRFLY